MREGYGWLFCRRKPGRCRYELGETAKCFCCAADRPAMLPLFHGLDRSIHPSRSSRPKLRIRNGRAYSGDEAESKNEFCAKIYLVRSCTGRGAKRPGRNEAVVCLKSTTGRAGACLRAIQ